MPVIFEKQIDSAKKLAVWQITESESELFELNGYKPDPSYSSKRNIELVVSRILLNYLLGNNTHLNLTKDQYGKPLLDNSTISVSFSHSQQMVACMTNIEGEPVGIDIEKKRERIELLSEKFCSEHDHSDFTGTMHYHLVWGGKEVLFKIYSKKELDFKEHLSIKFMEGSGTGNIHKGNFKASHTLGSVLIDDYILVWGF